MNFAVDLQPAHVRFGVGARSEVAEECDRLGVARVLLVCTPAGAARYREVAEALGARLAATFAEAEPHCPEPVLARCQALWRKAGADGVVTVGGGSTIALGKNLAAEDGAKFVCIPTTYSGSEMTDIFGRKVGNEKRTARSAKCRAHAVIYDPELTLGLPRHETVTTGMNSVQSRRSTRRSPIRWRSCWRARRSSRIATACRARRRARTTSMRARARSTQGFSAGC
jgi:maleylacetate reductase